MKFSKLGFGVLFALGFASSGGVFAADTANLAVSAAVSGNCKFNTGGLTLAFGALDPASSTDATGQALPTYWCTKGTPATGVSAGNGGNWDGSSRRMAGSGTASGDFIKYSLSVSGGTQTGGGKGTPLTLTIDGTIVNADYINATVGSYADTVVLTLSN